MYFCKKYPDLDVTREVLYTTHNSVKLSTSVQRYAFVLKQDDFKLFEEFHPDYQALFPCFNSMKS